jgi:hypothetical protein
MPAALSARRLAFRAAQYGARSARAMIRTDGAGTFANDPRDRRDRDSGRGGRESPPGDLARQVREGTYARRKDAAPRGWASRTLRDIKAARADDFLSAPMLRTMADIQTLKTIGD